MTKSKLATIYELGYNVVPVSSGIPLIEAVKPYQTKRVTAQELAQWDRLRQSRNANWAILTGAKPYNSAPALVCVDCDDEAAFTLAAKLCPPTRLVTATPSGGRHLYYRRPAVEVMGNRIKTIYKGRRYALDIKADGGMATCPGSVGHKPQSLGMPYSWLCPWTAEMIQSAPVYDPTWMPDEKTKSHRADDLDHEDAIAELEMPMGERKYRARRFVAKCPGARSGEGASAYCFALAIDLVWGFALDTESAIEILTEWAERDDQMDERGHHYPWKPKEIRHKVWDAVKQSYDGVVGDRVEPRIPEGFIQFDM